MYKNIGIIFLIFFFQACASYVTPVSKASHVLYNEALTALNSSNLEMAEKNFKVIVDQYPYTEESLDAQVFLIWIYFVEKKYVKAEVEIDSFLKYYVSNEYSSWVQYMKGMVQYMQVKTDTRDITHAKQAIVAFYDVYRKYRSTIYAIDAKFKVEAIKNVLAEKEFKIINQYIIYNQYIAAINASNRFIKNYSDTKFTPEVLYHLTELWLTLKVPEEAYTTVTVFGSNYPSSKWYKKALNLLQSKTEYKLQQKTP